MQSEIKNCQNCNQNFTVTEEDFDFYKKIDVPTPTICYQCRYQRRIAGRNEWVLYTRNCSLCQAKMVSIYNPEYMGTVSCLDCFWGEKFDALSYGKDFDFSRGFFEQFQEMRDATPKVAVAHFRCVNSPYTNQSQDLKNCYLTFAGDKSEDCMYGNWYFECKNSVDCSICYGSEFIYECLDTSESSRSSHLIDCGNCLESHFLKDCRNCNSCFCCVGLHGKSYYYQNEQLTKEEYEKRMKDFVWTRENIEKTKKQLQSLVLKNPQKFFQGHTIVNSTGDYVYNLKNSYVAFNAHELENISYCQDTAYGKDGRDITEVAYTELDYEIEGVGYSARNIAVSRSWNVFDSAYCLNCFSCESCFGCVSLNKKKYCIFNQQYSKEEYYALKEKIIAHMKASGEWGEFFPISIALFSYNETVAQEYFPLNKESALAQGYKWYERKDRNYNVTLQSKDVPLTIQETDDSILDQTISCTSHEQDLDISHYFNCTTAFRITKDELGFYRKMNLPVPNKCFMCRFQDRLRQRTPRNLWNRQCQCVGAHDVENKYTNTVEHDHGKDVACNRTFATSYKDEREEIVYCEECYKREIY